MNEAQVILGIDPGLATVGFAALKAADLTQILDFGLIETSPDTPFEKRLQHLFDDLQSLIEQFKPDLIVMEELFFSTNVKTAIDVAQARGALIAAAVGKDITVLSIKPNEVKLGFTGDGSADKRQMQEMVKLHFGLSELPQPDDAADAIAIAYVGYQRHCLDI